MIYEVNYKKKYGLSFFLFYFGIYLVFLIYSLYSSPSFSLWFKDELWTLVVIGPFYTIFFLYIFLKRSIIYKDYIERTFGIGPILFYRKTYPWYQVQKINVVTYFNGTRDSTKVRGKITIDEISLVIIDINPSELLEKIFLHTKIDSPCILRHTKSNIFLFIPENQSITIGRNSFGKLLEKDFSVSSAQCTIKRSGKELSIKDTAKAINPTLCMQKPISKTVPMVLPLNALITLGVTDFWVQGLNLKNNIIINTTKENIINFIYSKMKLIVITLLISVSIISIQILYSLIYKDELSIQCTPNNLSGCFDQAMALYKLYHYKSALNNLELACPINSQKTLQSIDPKYCAYTGLLHYEMGHQQLAHDYFVKSCNNLFDFACLMLSINSSNDKYVTESLSNLHQDCQRSTSSKSCKYLLSFYSLKNNIPKALEYLALSLQKDYKDFLWIMADPSLNNLRKSKEFESFWSMWLKRLEYKKIHATSIHDSLDISAYLKLKLFIEVHPKNRSQNCPSQGPKRCYEIISTKLDHYYKLVNSYEIWGSYHFMNDLFAYDQLKPGVKKIEGQLDEIEYYIMFYKNLMEKKFQGTQEYIWVLGLYWNKKAYIEKIINEKFKKLQMANIQHPRLNSLKLIWAQENISLAQIMKQKIIQGINKIYNLWIKDKLPAEMQDYFGNKDYGKNNQN